MCYRIAGESDPGAVRDSNQDTVFWHVSDDGGQALLVVADGMGGYQGGEIASQLAVEAVREALMPALEAAAPPAPEAVREQLDTAFVLANERIQTRRAEEVQLEKMGTTLVVAWLINHRAHIAHIGDSRCYRIRQDEPVCLTRDDTVVQNMLDDGSITEADAPHVPFRNVLTRAVGAMDQAVPGYRCDDLAEGDCLLLCSDGLTNAVSDSGWPALISAADTVGSAARALIDASLDNKAADNVSVVLLTLQ